MNLKINITKKIKVEYKWKVAKLIKREIVSFES